MRRLVAAAVALCAVAAAAPGAAREALPGFRTPSGTVTCFVADGPFLRCDVHGAAYAAALQQRCITRADVDWHGFELGRRTRGAVTCTGGILYNPDTQRPFYTRVAYGRTWRSGPFACVIRRSGVTCTTRAGHGLALSRASWRAW
jgi:hypothetical protein